MLILVLKFKDNKNAAVEYTSRLSSNFITNEIRFPRGILEVCAIDSGLFLELLVIVYDYMIVVSCRGSIPCKIMKAAENQKKKEIEFPKNKI